MVYRVTEPTDTFENSLLPDGCRGRVCTLRKRWCFAILKPVSDNRSVEYVAC